MRSRLLPPEDWGRLGGTELASVVDRLNPETTQVLVVETSEGAIVGCWALLTILHAEGIWIDPAYRRTGAVARRLLRAMRVAVTNTGAGSVVTGSCADGITDLLQRLGAKPVPYQEFVLPMDGLCRQP